MIVPRVIAYVMRLRFDEASAGDLDATIEVRVRVLAGRRPIPFRLRIERGRCDITPGRAPDAGAVATIGLDDAIRLVLGATGWPELLSRGRLEMAGDPFLALRFPSLFRLPAH
jgi:hypothetical protein